MAIKQFSKELILRYVLGEASETEQSEVEIAYFSDPGMLDEVWVVFDDLAGDYLRGEMAMARAASFERQLQSSPPLNARFEEQRALLSLVIHRSPSSATALPPAQKTASGWLGGYLNFPALRVSALGWGLAGAMIMLFIAGGFWLFREPSHNTLQNRSEVATQPPIPAPSAPLVTPTSPPPPSSSPLPERRPVLASLLLSTDLLRGENNAPIMTIASDVEILQLELELIPPISAYYRVEFQTDAGQTIQTWPRLRSVSQGSFSVVRLRLPAIKLTNAEYIVKLAGLKANEAPSPLGNYRFRLQRH